MPTNKISLDLSGVPQTLLLPLIGRALYSQKKNSPIHDERAVKLTQSLNYDFADLLQHVGNTTAWWMARAYHFDEAIKEFLKTHPTAVIVNLGAGLETAFYRVDNGKLTWVDLDLPEVIELREKLLPPPQRVHYVAKSILDFSWMNDIKQLGREFFFFAGGFFMYFTESQVKALFLEMAKQFPQSELIFDSISKSGVKHANVMLQQAKMTNAVLQWGLDDAKELETWSPRIQLIERIPYFKNIKTKFSFPLSDRIKMFFYDLVDKGGIIRLRFR